ncbi:unnamed protein product [Acanthoscelides obtectus]|uniref:Uncharacterized protein n=1 Tax=Acanthoscelides obtectus TaxID=200917 RepID=A0A9P0LBD2_ACAOB|nr:unnamed protein product [Acanthoscelides obtectus]CAK1659577.1 hypothetical protein AOBTE_LOCUS21551 [Acanthoscelides obtectus]
MTHLLAHCGTELQLFQKKVQLRLK